MTASWSAATRHWALTLTRFFSQTDTPGERDFAPFLKDRLSGLSYFGANPGFLRLERTRSDAQERSVLFALVKGSSAQALILTGHYDVVGIENYGSLAEWACEPEALLPRLVERLHAEDAQGPGLSPADRLALEDLESGDYLPGRGLLDMKSGLAAGLAVLERYSQLPGEARQGSLLFIAVPDEEIASNGIRSAGAVLPALAEEWGLHFVGAVNLDASDDHGDGSQGQSVYYGSVGKLLPSVLMVGRETHAGSPFSGVNAALLASELTRRVECNTSLCDGLNGTYTVPPTCLKQEDNKTHYDVTTPTTAWCYYNWLTLQQSADGVLETMKQLAGEALRAATAGLQDSAALFAQKTGKPIAQPDWQPQVYTYAKVKQLALQRQGGAFATDLSDLEARLAADPKLDTAQVCRRLTEAAWAASGLTGPAAVVGIAAIYYPPLSLEHAPESMGRLRQVISAVAADLSLERKTPISAQTFFPGISDMSFLGGRVGAAERQTLADNLPAWQRRAMFDYAATAGLNLAVVNIGPWGRDYHQRLERVFTPYAFETLPVFLWRIAGGLFAAPGSSR
jgi:arginine utilization protein RocB